MKKIILKSTDYIQYKGENLSYSYPYDKQYSDGLQLNTLSADDLKKECQKRWNDFSKCPIPSNYSKFKLAEDLAKAKGFDVKYSINKAKLNQNDDKINEGGQRIY